MVVATVVVVVVTECKCVSQETAVESEGVGAVAASSIMRCFVELALTEPEEDEEERFRVVRPCTRERYSEAT